VGDEDHGETQLLLELGDQLQDLRLDGDVERGGRFVGDEQLRLARERHRDQHALAHAARHLVRVLLDALASGWRCRPGRAVRSRAASRLARFMPLCRRSTSVIWKPT
jgi:hypothetical protein